MNNGPVKPEGGAAEYGCSSRLTSRSVAGLLLTLVMVAAAQGGEGVQKNGDDLITGVVIDQALTLVGHEFSRSFSEVWKESACVDSRILTIYERPSARWGSLVWVEYQHQMLYRSFLPPSVVKVRGVAQIAAQSVCRRVMDFEAQKALFVDPDLARDEVDW